MKSILLVIICALCACQASGPTLPLQLMVTPPKIPLAVTAAVLGLDIGSLAVMGNHIIVGKSTQPPTSQTLKIAKTSLGKPLLYIAALVQSDTPDGIFEPYKPRLISFTQEGHSIVVSDVRPHQQYIQETPPPHIVFQFPIVRETATEIEFDFVVGTNKLTQWALHEDVEKEAADVSNNYLRKISGTAQRLTIDQVIRSGHTLTVRHVFLNDEPSTFIPRESDPNGNIGYFTTPAFYRYGDSTPHHYITRWDVSRPIRVALSRVPAEWVPAISAGILAWNEVWGQPVFQIVNFQADVDTLDLDYDLIVHWIADDQLGIAFGYAFPHPATGKVLHADIILNSGWVKSMQQDAKQLRRLIPQAEGFQSAELCQEVAEDWPIEMKQLASQSSDYATTLMNARLQTLLTHETGHTLGLRHNFAGSLHNAIKSTQIPELLKDIAEGQPAADSPQPSISIMDYLLPIPHTLMRGPGAYDRAAIEWGYFSALHTPAQTPYWFCTDETTNDIQRDDPHLLIADCQRHDASTEPISSLENLILGNVNGYIADLLATYSVPQHQLDLARPPTTDYIKKWLYRLLQYTNPDTVVWSLNGKTSLQRRDRAQNALRYLRDPAHWETTALRQRLAELADLMQNGSKADKLRAIQEHALIQSNLAGLQKLLDAPLASLNKSS